MNPGTQDQAEGTFLKIKGKVKEVAGDLSNDPKLEAGGSEENIVAGKVQEELGQVKTVLRT